jgi:hypothetical protein
LYEFDETPDTKEYLTSRYGSTAGELYKLSYKVTLDYQGNNSAVYFAQRKYRFCDDYYYYYEGKNFSVFINFLEQVNAVNGKQLQVPDQVAADDLIRELVTEAFMLADDNFADGNNYYMFLLDGVWNAIVHDFDSVMLEKDSDDLCKNVYCYINQFHTDRNDEHGYPNSLISAIFRVPTSNVSFTYYMATFLQQLFPGVFLNATSPNPLAPPGPGSAPAAWGLPEIYAEMCRIISPWYQRDQLGQLAFVTTYAQFLSAANHSVNTLRSRSAMVAAEVGPPQPISGSSSADEDLTRTLAIAIPLTVVGLLVLIIVAAISLRKKRRTADEEDYRMLEE